MNKLIKKIPALLLPLIMLLVIGCASGKPNADNNPSGASIPENIASEMPSLSSVDNLLPEFHDKLDKCFDSEDIDEKYDSASSVSIDLSSLPTNQNGISYADGELTISKSGTYIISGALTGRIIVDAENNDKVRLVLLNAKIDSSSASAIKFKNASLGIITLSNDTDNQLSVSSPALSDSEMEDESNTHAVLSSNCDLIINGSGSISLNTSTGNAIKCDKSLCIAGGIYSVTAAKHGIRVQDECYISNGDFTITGGLDGIHVENQTEGGELFILNGSFNITAKGDGISTSGDLLLYGGSYSVKTGDGSASVTLKSDADGMELNPWGDVQSGEDNAVSQKGFKSESMLAIADGSFTIDTVDDSLHSGGDIGIAGGKFNLRSGDDAIHSDANILIEDGNFEIPYCYEGIEGITVTIKNGDYRITSSDDGINAANGNSESNWRDDPFTPDNSCFVLIDGGCFTIVSEGDCIDSNGTLTVNGGTLDLTCGGNGNTAIDATGGYTNNGGSVTTNDGSEQNGGQNGFGGGMGGHGGHGENGAPGKMHGEFPSGMPGGAPGDMPDGAPGDMPNGTPGSMPDGTPGGMPDGTHG